MKKLSRKHKIALVELVVILAVAVYFFFPRPLSSALGSGFDPDAVTGVQVDLTAFGGEAERGRTLSLSPDDPAWDCSPCSLPNGTAPTTWRGAAGM